MVRAIVSAFAAGVLLAALSACDQSTAADPDHQPRYRLLIQEDSRLRLPSVPAPPWIESCQRAAEANHHVLCPVSTGHRADAPDADYWTEHRMQSATPR